MSWPIFAVIQLGIVTLGVLLAAWLRNRELQRRYAELASASDEMLSVVEEAKAQLDAEAHVAWLSERVAALDGDDDTVSIQRLVLANELEASADFATELGERLGAAESAREAMREQWQEVRNGSFEAASKLIEEYPLSQPIIAELFQTYDSLDTALEFEPHTLPDAPEGGSGDVDPAVELEGVRAAKALLEKEFDILKATLDNTQAANAEDAEQAEDLKALLQQFTKDSRDMMECIQNLEAENQELREQLEASAGADATDDATDSESEAAQAEDAA